VGQVDDRAYDMLLDARDPKNFRNPELAARLIGSIRQRAAALAKYGWNDQRPLQLMEVCGTHTMAIAKNGIRSLLPSNIRLLSGPGCPVCVTANSDIDIAIALTRLDGLTVCTFGDMLRVPGSSSSLEGQRAAAADIKVVYSPLDALSLAIAEPARQVVFIGVGFETTSPIVAATILRAASLGVANFTVFAAFKLVPPALEALLQDPALALDGLLLPGHVSTILGLEAYRFIADEYQLPAVVTGFEPVDILAGIAMLLEQQLAKQQGTVIGIGNAYNRAVQPKGNPEARQSLDQVFVATGADWRGLGHIPASGLSFRPQYAAFDALKRFSLTVEETVEARGCRCGDILRGIISPPDCPHFGKTCTPVRPLGPCMVSSEGTCAAYYRYGIK